MILLPKDIEILACIYVGGNLLNISDIRKRINSSEMYVSRRIKHLEKLKVVHTIKKGRCAYVYCDDMELGKVCLCIKNK